ncbi:MAG: ligand-binding protein SH3, partial [Gammaproteobacteria bacterium]|nr:ligand-binding protein SH3 [Gammaproteobacteria bacterium]
MSNLIGNFPYDGVVTVNRVILKSGYTVDDLQERVA